MQCILRHGCYGDTLVSLYVCSSPGDVIIIIVAIDNRRITGGELFDEVVAREFYSERDASRCMQQVLSSISFCHRNCIIHRDLKVSIPTY